MNDLLATPAPAATAPPRDAALPAGAKRPDAPKKPDADVDEMLAALKRKMATK